MAEYTGYQVYRNMVTLALGPGSIERAVEVIEDVRRNLKARQEGVSKLEGRLAAAWTGNASNAARESVKPLNDSIDDLLDKLDKHEMSLRDQGQQFKGSSGRLHDIPEKAPQKSGWDSMTPWDTGHEKAINDYNRKDNENKQQYTLYDGATKNNTADLPNLYTNAPRIHSNVTIASAVHTGGVAGPDSGPPQTHSGGATGGTGGHSGGESVSGPPVYTGGHGAAGPSRAHRPAGGAPIRPPRTQPAGDSISSQGVGAQPGTSGRQQPIPGTNRQAAATGSGIGGSFGVPPGGFGPSGGGVAGSRGGIGGTATGGGPGGSTRPDLRGGAAEPGGRTGVGAEPGAASAARGSAAVGGARSGAGAAGGPMGAGGGRGGKEEDKEHSAADYLVNEQNASEIVGDLPLTPPPVIGG